MHTFLFAWEILKGQATRGRHVYFLASWLVL